MILRAKYAIDSSGRILKDAEIEVEFKQIAAIRDRGADPTVQDSEIIDLGNSALLPGFVNAHTHMELSVARSRVEPCRRFTDWLRQVIHVTREWSGETFDSSLAEGVTHALQEGTTSVGDINGRARGPQTYFSSGMRVRFFHEVIDFNPRMAEATFESLKARINNQKAGEDCFVGIAPHTPYTVSEKLLRYCVQLAHENDWRLCIHLAETKAESEFLSKGTGEIFEFRKDFGLPPEWRPPRTSPVRYLERLGFFEKPATLVHCNYIGNDDYDIIARSDSSVVFCPRSHRYFGHDSHPFVKMLDHGINVALGTDSLLSSPTLGMLDEMKFLRKEFPGIAPEVILSMTTINGLKALAFPARFGVGERADIVGVTLPEEDSAEFNNPLEAVFSERSRVIFSMSGGRILFDSRCSSR